MFTIIITTYTSVSHEISIFEEDLANFYFEQALKCLDVRAVTIIDAFTGEIVEQVCDGKILVSAREVVVD